MSIKIEIKGSGLFCLDTVTGINIISEPSKYMWYKEDDLLIGRVSFYYANSLDGDEVSKKEIPFFSLADAVDTNDVAFTTQGIRDFCTANLGKSNGGSTPTTTDLYNIVIVNQSNKDMTLGGVIDSTKQYFLDGVIDMGTTQITVPIGGMTIKGYSFDISGIISTEDNHTMFVSESEAIGSGNLLVSDCYVTELGASSKVHELYATDLSSPYIEYMRVNFINCTSLGDIYGYSQWLEDGTGRFGGAPSITFHGLWTGGAKIVNSYTRGLAGTWSGSLFQEGAAFVMNSRFYTDFNVDLSTLSSLTDFTPLNFPNPETLQFHDCIITRDGASDDADSNLTPNVTATNTCSSWVGNVGLPNTFVDNFTKIIKSATPPADTTVLWLEDEVDHVSLYAYDDRYGEWTGTERQYEFITPHIVTAEHNFEVAASEYEIALTHDCIPVKMQITMSTAVVGVIGVVGETAGLIGEFVLDGSSRSLQGSITNPSRIEKGDKLSLVNGTGSADIENSVIILTVKNIE